MKKGPKIKINLFAHHATRAINDSAQTILFIILAVIIQNILGCIFKKYKSPDTNKFLTLNQYYASI